MPAEGGDPMRRGAGKYWRARIDRPMTRKGGSGCLRQGFTQAVDPGTGFVHRNSYLLRWAGPLQAYVSARDRDMSDQKSVGAALASPLDLKTERGRREARRELVWGDHGFLRTRFRNLHRLSDDMYRANQPSPEHIADYARELGLRTIINLRGSSPKGYYLLEQEACRRHDVELVDFQVFSREVPTPETVLAAKKLFETISYPALMHCKSGADRAGVMAVLYVHFRLGLPVRDALEQLSFKYLHIRAGKTGVLDFFFETYLSEGLSRGLSFAEWETEGYDQVALKQRFLATRKWKLNLDQLLRRE